MGITHAKLYDFEAGGMTEIPVEVNKDTVVVTVPTLYAYSIVELLP